MLPHTLTHPQAPRLLEGLHPPLPAPPPACPHLIVHSLPAGITASPGNALLSPPVPSPSSCPVPTCVPLFPPCPDPTCPHLLPCPQMSLPCPVTSLPLVLSPHSLSLSPMLSCVSDLSPPVPMCLPHSCPVPTHLLCVPQPCPLVPQLGAPPFSLLVHYPRPLHSSPDQDLASSRKPLSPDSESNHTCPTPTLSACGPRAGLQGILSAHPLLLSLPGAPKSHSVHGTASPTCSAQ